MGIFSLLKSFWQRTISQKLRSTPPSKSVPQKRTKFPQKTSTNKQFPPSQLSPQKQTNKQNIKPISIKISKQNVTKLKNNLQGKIIFKQHYPHQNIYQHVSCHQQNRKDSQSTQKIQQKERQQVVPAFQQSKKVLENLFQKKGIQPSRIQLLNKKPYSPHHDILTQPNPPPNKQPQQPKPKQSQIPNQHLQTPPNLTITPLSQPISISPKIPIHPPQKQITTLSLRSKKQKIALPLFDDS